MSKKKKVLKGNFVFKSDIGEVRLTNEDRSLVLTNSNGDVLLLVADGLGGERKGDYAAQICVDTIRDSFLSLKKFRTRIRAFYWTRAILRKANSEIYNQSLSAPDYQGMGTTVTMVLLTHWDMFIAQVGDSRAYALSNGELLQLTEDQTLVQYYYKTGKISQEQRDNHPQKNILTNALGIYPTLSVSVRFSRYYGETLFLCSDGLYNNMPRSDIRDILLMDETLSIKADMLVGAVYKYGAPDNLSVVIWEATK
ncbi:MAG: protein phosphatase 2C domain-containing protein [Coprobacillus sp.]|nr:protein phosphatase 2C domain-containing protein [Coprobacillus sp.]